MSETRWKIRVNDSDFYKVGPHEFRIPEFVGERGRIDLPNGQSVPRYTLIGDSIAEVMDLIAYHEGETP